MRACGLGSMAAWEPGRMGHGGPETRGPGDLGTWPLQYVECVGSRVYELPL